MNYKPMHDSLDSIISLILSHVEPDGRWSVATDELISAGGVPLQDFYGTMYRLDRRVGFSEGLRGFSEETAGELVTLLEAFYGDRTEAAFTDAGLFLPHEHRLELMELLLSEAGAACSRHTLELETFWEMVRVFGSFRKAVDTYLEEYLKPDAVIEAAADAFCAARGEESQRRCLALEHLALLFRRHIVSRESLFAPIEAEFTRSAFARGYFTAREKTFRYDGDGGRADGRNRTGRQDGSPDRELSGALRLFSLPESDLSRELLKKRYRDLVRRYHPDLNPEGLEMTKRLNTAYAMLLSRCAAS